MDDATGGQMPGVGMVADPADEAMSDEMPGLQADGMTNGGEMAGVEVETAAEAAMSGEMPGPQMNGDGGDAQMPGVGTAEPPAEIAMVGEEAVVGEPDGARDEPLGLVAVAGPRQIVPPESFLARGLAPAVGSPPPSLQNHGGPVIGAVEVVPIYWGAAWASGPNAALATQLDGFFDFILTSAYIDLLHEYSTPTTEIKHGQRLASARIANSEPGTVSGGVRQVTDGQIQTALQGWISNHTVPATTANTLYFVFLPPSVVSILGTDRSCQSFCGYHNHIGNVYYAVIPFADCAGCVFQGQFLDTLTEVSSHELAEAITDPELNAWWETGAGDEIGDICNRQTTRLGGYLVQTEWSNAQNACVVAPLPAVTAPRQSSSPVVAWGANRLDAFVLGTNRALYHKWWNGSAWGPGVTGYEFMGGICESAPQVVAWGPNRLDVFVTGTDSALYHKWWNGSAWGPSVTGYENMGGICVDDPRIVSWAPNRLDAFVLGTDRALYHKWWNGSAWGPSLTGYERLGGICVGQPEVVAWGPNRLDIFVIGTDRALYHKWWNGSAWGPSPTGYERLGGICMSAPRAVAWGPNRLDIFVVGTDGALYHKWWNGSAWGPSPTGFERMGGICVGQPEVVAWGPNRLDVFVLGTDSALYHKWWNGSAWGPSAHGLRVHGRRLHRRAAGRRLGTEPARRVRHGHRQRALPQVVERVGLGPLAHGLRVHGRRRLRLLTLRENERRMQGTAGARSDGRAPPRQLRPRTTGGMPRRSATQAVASQRQEVRGLWCPWPSCGHLSISHEIVRGRAYGGTPHPRGTIPAVGTLLPQMAYGHGVDFDLVLYSGENPRIAALRHLELQLLGGFRAVVDGAEECKVSPDFRTPSDGRNEKRPQMVATRRFQPFRLRYPEAENPRSRRGFQWSQAGSNR